MLKHPELTSSRIRDWARRFLALVYPERIPLEILVAGPVDRITHDEAQELEYKPAELGLKLDPQWSTHWFKLSAELPKEWRDKPVSVFFDTRCEGLAWISGKPYQGVNYLGDLPFKDGGRIEIQIPKDMVASGKVELEVETGSNGLFGEWGGRMGVLEQAEAVTFDKEAWDLAHDLMLLVIYFETLDKSKLDNFQGHILATLNRLCNVVVPEDKSTWAPAKKVLSELFENKNATYVHEISAIGHAHIDTAWLWPLDETKRKCARTFSSALLHMAEYPEYLFSCPQAQQYVWMEKYYPTIFEGIKEAVKRGQWVPVGGTWVEPDCNIPSGESLVRQFLYGKRYFRKTFGWDCREFWNPDVFGYSGALPQIIRGADIDYFLTQKLSWNQFNKPLHQSFLWEGIDGTQVLTHFPPMDTYNALAGREVVTGFLSHAKNHQDNEHTNQGILLFGWGDGGGGPDRHMLEMLRRVKDFQGFPRTEQRNTLDFFKRLEANLDDPVVIRGELYLEFHRGTYTSQAANKRGNRSSELALRAVEMLNALACRDKYPQGEIDRLWKIVLKNQFHDILPGSSITMVYDESKREYAHVLEKAAELQKQALDVIAEPSKPGHSAVNTLGWTRRGLIEAEGIGGAQKSFRGRDLAWAEVPAIGLGALGPAAPDAVSAKEENGFLVLENGHVRAEFAKTGVLVRLMEKGGGREFVAADRPANQFVIFDDPGNAWDVEVYQLETRATLPEAKSAKVIETGPVRAGLEFAVDFAPSSLKVRAFLAADSKYVEFECEVDWAHKHRFLKVEFPVLVRNTQATYEIAFGSISRPTHFNTPYDFGQFEVNGHRWADLSEPDAGVALLTDSKYGYSTYDGVMRISLLRSPSTPDPVADEGHHEFRYAVYPHLGTHVQADVVRRAHEFNAPWFVVPGAQEPYSCMSIDTPDLVIDTVKKAEDSSDLVIRLYEANGCRGDATLTVNEKFSKVERVNLLEEKPEPVAHSGSDISLTYRPFEIITLKLS
jgi:alpha-mannosidase